MEGGKIPIGMWKHIRHLFPPSASAASSGTGMVLAVKASAGWRLDIFWGGRRECQAGA